MKFEGFWSSTETINIERNLLCKLTFYLFVTKYYKKHVVKSVLCDFKNNLTPFWPLNWSTTPWRLHTFNGRCSHTMQCSNDDNNENPFSWIEKDNKVNRGSFTDYDCLGIQVRFCMAAFRISLNSEKFISVHHGYLAQLFLSRYALILWVR